MRTTSRRPSARGGRLRVAAAGGLALGLTVAGAALALGAGGLVLRPSQTQDQAVAGAPMPVIEGTPVPYVVQPRIRLEEAGSPTSARASSPDARPSPAAGVPHRLVVRRLGVDAPVVGIDAPGGVLLPPADPRTLGWWRSGAQAGAHRGSVLITGHTVSSGGGAFDDLDTLRAGDLVDVGTTHSRIRYRVTDVLVYRKATLAEHAAALFSQTVPGRLVLVTCEDWNGSEYLSNAVVIAEPLL